MMVEDRYFYDPVAGKLHRRPLPRRSGAPLTAASTACCSGTSIRTSASTIATSSTSRTTCPAASPGCAARSPISIARGVKVFLPTMPWDNGTRPHGEPRLGAMAELVKAVGADGINGDTYNGVPRAFFDACDAARHPVVLQPESTAQAGDMLNWNVQSWSKKCRRT